jgi:methylthioribulose-1-phosphate dehydratase
MASVIPSLPRGAFGASGRSRRFCGMSQAVSVAPVTPETIDALRAIGGEFHGRSWSLGTSSNYSVVVSRDPLELVITASGKDKSALGRDDFVRVDAAGRLLGGPSGPAAPGRKSSAETLLHCTIAGLVPDVGAVLHTHSVWGTILSGADLDRGSLRIEGYEMLKGLDGVATHETCAEVPIFANAQDMPALATAVRERLGRLDWSAPRPPAHAFLLARHGLYTWGRDLAEARRHVEILEFLFECVARARTLPGPQS